MKIRDQFKLIAHGFIITVALFWTACYGPAIRSVDQPLSAEPYDTVEVLMAVSYDDQSKHEAETLEDFGNGQYPNLSICLPDGWSLPDSVPYEVYNQLWQWPFEGHLVYSFDLSLLKSSEVTPPTGYRWWSGEGTLPLDLDYDTLYLVYPEYYLDSGKGIALVDYAIGYRDVDSAYYLGWDYLNDVLLEVGLVPSCTVVNTLSNGHGSLRWAVNSVCNEGDIYFDLPARSQIDLMGDLRLFRDVRIHGPGKDQLTLYSSSTSDYLLLIDHANVEISGLTLSNSGLNAVNIGVKLEYSDASFDDIKVEGFSSNGMMSIGSSLNVDHSELKGNQGLDGQALNCEGGTAKIRNTRIYENAATGLAPGYGSLHFYACDSKLLNLLIDNNQSTAIIAVNSEITACNLTIVDNTFFAVDIASAIASFDNTIFWGNNSDEEEMRVMSFPDNQAWLITECCVIENGREGVIKTGSGSHFQYHVSNMDLYPELEPSAAEFPYALTTASPYIDNGTNNACHQFITDDDLAGNVRYWDGDMDGDTTLDRGAYEYNSVPVGVNSEPLSVTGTLVRIYPNPAKDNITVLIEDNNSRKALLSIADLTGKLYVSQTLADLDTGQESRTVPISFLQSGTYLVTLKMDSAVHTQKLVVSK